MQKFNQRLRLLSLLALLAFAILACLRPVSRFYPLLDMEAPGSGASVKVGFLFDGQPTTGDCDTLIGNVGRVSLDRCPTCKILRTACLPALSDQQQSLFSDDPINQPAGRMYNGVITFQSEDKDMALAACRSAQALSQKGPNPIICQAAGEARPTPKAPMALSRWTLPLAGLAFLASWAVCWLIVRYEHLHAHLTHDHVDSGPQKYHEVPTPRIGGMALIAGLLVAGSLLSLMEAPQTSHAFGLLLLAGAPAFVGGLVEDVTKKVGVIERLLLTMLAGTVSAWLLGAVIDRLGIPLLDDWLDWLPFAVIFTTFAVGGIANAVNIIDGYNGLASGFSIIVLAAMAIVANHLGDNLVFVTALVLACSLFGFAVWNWPSGKIFLGDGGAYLLGFLLAQLAILIVIRNPHVSPWFPLLLLIYPVFETFYTIYRRKVLHSCSPGAADNKHLHQLLHDTVIAPSVHTLDALSKNSRVAVPVWAAALIIATTSVAFYSSTPILMGLTALYCVGYVLIYRTLFRRLSRERPAPSQPDQGE